MAPKVGVAGVAPEVGEKAPLCTPLCTLLALRIWHEAPVVGVAVKGRS